MKKILLFVVCIGMSLSAITSTTYAGDVTDSSIDIFNTTRVEDPGEPSSSTQLINDLGELIVTTLLFVAGAAGIIMLGYGGIAYTTAGNDENKTSKAKRILVYAVISIVLAGASWQIRRATENATNTLRTTSNATEL